MPSIKTPAEMRELLSKRAKLATSGLGALPDLYTVNKNVADSMSHYLDRIEEMEKALRQIADYPIDASFLADHVIWAKGLARETLKRSALSPEPEGQ